MKPSETLTSGQPTGPKAPVRPAPLALVSVPFQEGALLAAAGSYPEEGDRPVPLAPFCERLGINADTQRKKLARVAWTCPVIMTVQIPGDDQARRLACIPLRALAGWLFTINPGKVAPEARAALVAYQREAADVLYRHFLAPSAPGDAPASLPADVGAKLEAVRAGLSDAMWALGLPLREAPGACLQPREGGASLGELCADVAHLGTLLGFEPSGEMPDGIIVPTIGHRAQTVLRLRAWLAACARPLTHEERQERQGLRGVTAQQAADSYNRWAHARGLSPMSAGSIGRWLADSALCGYQRTVSRKGHRYQLALLPAPASVANQLEGRGT